MTRQVSIYFDILYRLFCQSVNFTTLNLILSYFHNIFLILDIIFDLYFLFLYSMHIKLKYPIPSFKASLFYTQIRYLVSYRLKYYDWVLFLGACIYITLCLTATWSTRLYRPAENWLEIKTQIHNSRASCSSKTMAKYIIGSYKFDNLSHIWGCQ